MGLFDFWKKKRTTGNVIPEPHHIMEDRPGWTGKDFEFLITGDINIPAAGYDQVMTPNTFAWTKVNRDDWTYYQVGVDEFSYSWEVAGIQMTFNQEILFEKARAIADEVIGNITTTGQEVELVVLNSSQVYRFD